MCLQCGEHISDHTKLPPTYNVTGASSVIGIPVVYRKHENVRILPQCLVVANQVTHPVVECKAYIGGLNQTQPVIFTKVSDGKCDYVYLKLISP